MATINIDGLVKNRCALKRDTQNNPYSAPCITTFPADNRLHENTSSGEIKMLSKQQCYTQRAKQSTKTRNKVNRDGSQRSKFEPMEMVRTAQQTGCHEKKRDGRPQTLMLQLPTASRAPTEHSPPQESQAQTYKPARDQHTLAARGRETIRRCRRSV
ncbi:hypothetical protein Bca4012_065858 [Brassica carinata]